MYRHSVHVHVIVSHDTLIIAVLALLLSQCQKLFKMTGGRGKIKGDWSRILVGIPALFRS